MAPASASMRVDFLRACPSDNESETNLDGYRLGAIEAVPVGVRSTVAVGAGLNETLDRMPAWTVFT